MGGEREGEMEEGGIHEWRGGWMKRRGRKGGWMNGWMVG